MRTHVQVALVIAALLYFCWSLALLVAPGPVHRLFSSGPLDPASVALLGAGLFAFAVVFLIAAHRAEREMLHAAAAGLLLFGFTAAYQMFLAGGMPHNAATVASLVLDLVLAFYLLVGLSDAAMKLGTKAPARPRPGRRRRKR